MIRPIIIIITFSTPNVIMHSGITFDEGTGAQNIELKMVVEKTKPYIYKGYES